MGFLACGVTAKNTTSSAVEGGGGGGGAAVPDGQHAAGVGGGAQVGPEMGGALSVGGSVAQASGSSAVESGGARSAGGDPNEEQAGAPAAGVASPGCQLANASPEVELPFFDGTSVLLPTGYDGVTPTPILFGFHESGNRTEIPKLIPATHPLRQNYVLVVPTNRESVGGFENEQYTTVAELYQAVAQTICFDTRNVFGVGHSSGARFMTHAGAKANFRAAAVIGTLDQGTPSMPIPSLVIHGANDFLARSFQDLDGSVALSRYITRNGCGASSVPFSVPSCQSGTVQVTPGCVDYLDCAQPLRFCRHDDPGLEGYNDGWPCFATDLLYEFFEGQRIR